MPWKNGPIFFQAKKKTKKLPETRTPTVDVRRSPKGSGAGKCTIATWTNEASVNESLKIPSDEFQQRSKNLELQSGMPS